MDRERIIIQGLNVFAEMVAERVCQMHKSYGAEVSTTEGMIKVSQATEWFNMWYQEKPPEGERILRADEVMKKIGVSRSTIWRWERQGKFPKRRQLPGSAVGWLNTEIDLWIRSQPDGHL